MVDLLLTDYTGIGTISEQMASVLSFRRGWLERLGGVSVFLRGERSGLIVSI